MPLNHAAWIPSKSAKTLEVKIAPYTSPDPDEIVVRNRAVAINPINWFKLDAGNMIFSYIKYPCILGNDLAGEVTEVGKNITRFKVGDRVLGLAVAMHPTVNNAAEGAFQAYTVIRSNMATPIPSSVSFEEACHITKVNWEDPGKALLIWGGSTSVGSNAIQLAVASGVEVITTCSSKNFDYVKKLGACQAFDYRSPTIIKDITRAFKEIECAGAFAIGDGSLKACIAVVAGTKGNKFVAQASVTQPDEWPSSALDWISVGATMVWDFTSTYFSSKVRGMGKKFIFGSDLVANEVGKAIYEDFLPDALAQGKFVTAPEPLVVGTGLECIQQAYDVSRKGVSAKKVVVSL